MPLVLPTFCLQIAWHPLAPDGMSIYEITTNSRQQKTKSYLEGLGGTSGL